MTTTAPPSKVQERCDTELCLGWPAWEKATAAASRGGGQVEERGGGDVTAEAQARAILRMARSAAGARPSGSGAWVMRRSLERFLRRRREAATSGRGGGGGASSPSSSGLTDS
ncbi:hypothetical protein ACP70R_028883 [Stipagrostis hirtigluma subsp. patula]